jgi:hypothetical protein
VDVGRELLTFGTVSLRSTGCDDHNKCIGMWDDLF